MNAMQLRPLKRGRKPFCATDENGQSEDESEKRQCHEPAPTKNRFPILVHVEGRKVYCFNQFGLDTALRAAADRAVCKCPSSR